MQIIIEEKTYLLMKKYENESLLRIEKEAEDLSVLISIENKEEIKQRLELKSEADKSLFIISDAQLVEKINENNCAVAAYCDEKKNIPFVYETDMVIEGLEEVDISFLTAVYNRKHKLPVTIAQTPRLIIREMTLDDLDELYNIYADKEVTRYMEGLYEDRQKEEEFVRAYIEKMYGFYGYGVWVIIEKQSQKLIGRAGLSNRKINNENAIELGYMLGKNYQGRGYALEACEKILEIAKMQFEIKEIYCFIQVGNIASVRLAKKLGFTREGIIDIDNKMHIWYIKEL